MGNDRKVAESERVEFVVDLVELMVKITLKAMVVATEDEMHCFETIDAGLAPGSTQGSSGKHRLVISQGEERKDFTRESIDAALKVVSECCPECDAAVATVRRELGLK